MRNIDRQKDSVNLIQDKFGSFETNTGGGIAAPATITTTDHGDLTGLLDDDHAQYLRTDGVRGLTGNWDAGSFKITAQQFESDIATGTAPFVVASTTLVTNLNADLWDGYQFADYFNQAVKTTSTPIFPTVYGSSVSGGNLTLQSTSHATKGKILFGTSAYDEVNNRLGIGTTTPNNLLSVYELIDFNNTDFNTKLGYQAGKNIVSGAQYNVYLGYRAGYSGAATTNAADYNTVIGYAALYANTTGYSNTANGAYALYANTTGYHNTAIGYATLYSNTTGYRNIGIGSFGGRNITTGNSNTFVGYLAGYNVSQLVSAVNSMALGANTYTTASNQFVYGDANVTQHLFNAGNLQLNLDNQKIVLGTGQDATIYYDGTDLIIDPDVVGTGGVRIGGKLINDSTLRLKGYTVATLPAGVQGDTAFVTDATAPTFLGALTGGGAVVTPVFYNGTAWVSC